MKTIVVGGSGFLGGAVADELVRRGREVEIFDIAGSQAACDARWRPRGRGRFARDGVRFRSGDIRDRDALASAFAGAEEIYHFAGQLGTSELDETPAEAAEVNVIGSINVFETAIAAGVPRVFHASKPNVWLNAYTVTKHAAERFGELYAAAQADTRITSLRFFNAYGPHQHTHPVRKLVPTFALQALAGRPLEVFGDGEQIVDMVFAPDLARLTVDYAAVGPAGEAPDCGRGVPITVNAVAESVAAWAGGRVGIRHLPMRVGEVEHTTLVADTSRLLEVVGGDGGFADWETSLALTLDWYARRAGRPVDAGVHAVA
ncbi:MAG: NAD-dependent epimerase/dehydratase family protein [Solirubrobacteraceae bacterium]|nr:NAD-dependent epimerase/dehydratase family protein [Solirubrobacteraceae bacterium]